jgi:hypothetical protein
MSEPEAWQTNATAPFLTIEDPRGTVGVWALGAQRFRVAAPGVGSEVEGFDEARTAARRQAEGRG